MAMLAHFTEKDGNGEFVVIFDNDEPDTSEYEEGEYELARKIVFDGDVSIFPCDRELHAR